MKGGDVRLMAETSRAPMNQPPVSESALEHIREQRSHRVSVTNFGTFLSRRSSTSFANSAASGRVSNAGTQNDRPTLNGIT